MGPGVGEWLDVGVGDPVRLTVGDHVAEQQAQKVVVIVGVGEFVNDEVMVGDHVGVPVSVAVEEIVGDQAQVTPLPTISIT